VKTGPLVQKLKAGNTENMATSQAKYFSS